ncbi:hypothetical protein [Desulfosporosinus sp. BG]|nr:hypothetical protein [Desulfosporosinus sp. BG]ODA42450.1 hypothetical protein DSBG_0837 [Desulfosporosinus sp. BG]
MEIENNPKQGEMLISKVEALIHKLSTENHEKEFLRADAINVKELQ